MAENNFYHTEENNIILNETKWFAKRIVTTFQENSKDNTIGFLTDNFTNLQNDISILQKDYNAAEEKVKLAGKISRLKQYAATAKAVGDYALIFEPLEKMEAEILLVVDANIAKREAIFNEATLLIANEKEWKANTEKLLQLTKDFRALPLVPDGRIEELRVKFEQLKDDFFTKKQSHYEDQEKILLDNLAHKLEICEKAEALATSVEWKKTTEDYNKLNEEWKSIGAIPRHRNDELWLRFNNAKDIFFGKKKEHYEHVKGDQDKNLVLKMALIERAEALKDSRDWKKTSDEFNTLLEEWKKTGRVSAEQNDDVWEKFNGIRNVFYKAKDEYYSSIKLNLEDNYAKKMAIVVHAESVANNPIADWETATATMLEMTDEWKKIGRIGKEHGDGPWDRFLAAKKTFFDNKDEERNKRRSEGSKVLGEKVNRNRGYAGKLARELQMEQEVLADFEDRLKNIHPGVRSFETKERYENIIADAKQKVTFLENKINEVKANMETDEKEFKYMSRPFVKKEFNNKEGVKTEGGQESKPRAEFKPREFKPKTEEKETGVNNPIAAQLKALQEKQQKAGVKTPELETTVNAKQEPIIAETNEALLTTETELSVAPPNSHELLTTTAQKLAEEPIAATTEKSEVAIDNNATIIPEVSNEIEALPKATNETEQVPNLIHNDSSTTNNNSSDITI
jgi:Domain of Unknown Function (DUF349)